MRTYIFTDTELNAIEEFIQSGRRNPTVNKLVHYIKQSNRLFTEIQLFLELWSLAHKPRAHKPKGLPGRPPKI